MRVRAIIRYNSSKDLRKILGIISSKGIDMG
nr:MAG TPA: hypothetical protein [Caudoviricetes sp.]